MKARRTFIHISILVMAFYSSCEERMDDEQISKNNPGLQKEKNTGNQRLASGYRFTGQEGDPIDYALAGKWVNNFQDKHVEGTMAHFFGYEIINQILEQESVVGIRMYYALDDSGERQIILVGVNESGENIVPGANGRSKDEGVVGDASYPCPTYCSGNGTSL